MKSKVSIVVPVYNSSQYLNQCLDSILKQTLYEIEVICVNDGSTDNSLDILQKYARNDQRVIIINQNNFGVSVARNAGLNSVSGEYFMFVDSDDWIALDMCKNMYLIAETEHADCVMCDYVKEFANHSIVCHIFEQKKIVWNKNEIMNNLHRKLFGLLGNELKYPEKGDVIVSPCMQLFKTSKFQKIRFTDIKTIGTFEDGLYQIDVYKDCERFVYVNKPYYYYRKTNSNSITTAYKSDLYEQWKNLFQIMEQIILDNHLSDEYEKALSNRICMSVIGLGLNQIHSSKGIFYDSKKISSIITSEMYKKAFLQLEYNWFPIHWKIFFYFAKNRCAIALVIMLHTMDILRRIKR